MAKQTVKKHKRKVGKKKVTVKKHKRKRRAKYPKRPFRKFTHKSRVQRKDRFGRFLED